MTKHTWRWLLLIVGGLCAPTFAAAQPPQPPLPAKFHVILRYAIPSPRDEHVRQYDSLIAHLQKLGFEFEPPLDKHPETDREDRTKQFLEGAIDGKKALRVRDHPAVQSLLLRPLAPEEFKLPEGPDDPVLLRLQLAGGLSTPRQRELANQTRVVLYLLGFKEAFGYDQRGYAGKLYTRMVGTVPRKNLDLLQRDLRGIPAGWVGPLIPRDELPLPFAGVNPIEVIEVLPDTQALKALPGHEPRAPEFLEKLSPDLWQLLNGKEAEPGFARVQVVFAGMTGTDDSAWKLTLAEAAPGFFVEARMGQFVTGIVPLSQIKNIASSPLVSCIRLPRLPRIGVDPGIKIKGDNAKALALTGLKVYHDHGYRGKGVRVGIIGRDFRGWEKLVQEKLLPPKTRLVDLTTEMDPEIYPLPYLGDANAIGHGTLCAQAAALAAPQAEIVLIRTEAGAPHHLQDVARYVRGGRASNTLEQRHGELTALGGKLLTRRAELLKERREILDDFIDETDLRESREFLGPLFSWLYSNREWHRQRMQHQDKLEAEHRVREARYRKLLGAVASLEGIPIVVNAYAWSSGFPLGAASPLSRRFDETPQGPLWFQAVGNTRGQSWLGPFRHLSGDPVMKFADDKEVPKGRWDTDVNFLAWQPYQGTTQAELPEKARLRFTVQWREPHDPDYYLRSEEEDLYRKPLANVRLMLLRQRDPEAKTLPADLFETIAVTKGWPERLEHLPDGSIYEHVLEVPLDKAGRYAIQFGRRLSSLWALTLHPGRKTPTFALLEGLTPTGIRPLGVPNLKDVEKNWELRPRIFVEVIDEKSRLLGRAIFADYATEAGVIGLPADARGVISVGSASFKNQPQPYSAFGAPMLMELARRPTVYAYDELDLAGGGAFGTSIANAFAAGMAATLQSYGATRPQIEQWLRAREGQVLSVPVTKK